MKTIVVTCLKGGCGKTTCTAGLIKALRRRGFNVGGLDADYRAPNLPFFFGLEELELLQRTEGDVLIAPKSVEGIPIFSLHHLWPPDQAVMVSNEDAIEDMRQILTPGLVDWGDPLDYLVIDTPPDSVGTISIALDTPNLWGCIVICQPSRVSRADAMRTISLLREKEVPIASVIINQAYLDGMPDRPPVTLFDLKPVQLADEFRQLGIRDVHLVPHARVLDAYFDHIVDSLLTASLVTLKVTRSSEEPWRRVSKLLKVLRALKGEKD